MRPSWRRGAVLATGALALILALAACGSSGTHTQDPPTVSSSKSNASDSSASPSPSTAVTSSKRSEAADRAAVEAAWSDYWRVYDTLMRQPETTWSATVSKVAVDPMYSELIKADKAFVAAGIGAYGHRIIHPYWTQPVAGKTQATLMDCQDESSPVSCRLIVGGTGWCAGVRVAVPAVVCQVAWRSSSSVISVSQSGHGPAGPRRAAKVLQSSQRCWPR